MQQVQSARKPSSSPHRENALGTYCRACGCTRVWMNGCMHVCMYMDTWVTEFVKMDSVHWESTAKCRCWQRASLTCVHLRVCVCMCVYNDACLRAQKGKPVHVCVFTPLARHSLGTGNIMNDKTEIVCIRCTAMHANAEGSMIAIVWDTVECIHA